MKKEAAYGLFEGRMVPLAVCSFMNFSSSCCLAWDKCMVLLMRVGRAQFKFYRMVLGP